ncbi:MAG: DUF455 family protein [Bdellovibrionales bacterium]|nr:DUF455 family protein [Bdellovibrionales bacterium]
MKRDWSPFRILPNGERPAAPRPMQTHDGIVDRLRAAAFAEIQAREAFLWAAERFTDAPAELRDAWIRLAREEEKHLGWLLSRMRDLGHSPDEVGVSDQLWHSFMKCETAKQFSIYMATAEERGRRAGERFGQGLAGVDPVSAKIFETIAIEEVGHIRLAQKFFPEDFAEELAQRVPATVSGSQNRKALGSADA